jgi:ribosome-associated protein
VPDPVDIQNARDVLINREPIELYKVLKFEGLVGSGGEAKTVIDDGLVSVNGDIEHRRRRKLVAGDVVVFADVALCLVRE